ncbi:MAG: PAS domain-containing protein [Desulfovibrionaceae bacterium]|nr:PAS domain-containing protein [Desulfovibrionaceae bacterium]
MIANAESKAQKFGKISLLIGGIVAVILGIAVGLVCLKELDRQHLVLMQNYRENAQTWLTHASENVRRKQQDWVMLLERLRNTETYAMFAADLAKSRHAYTEDGTSGQMNAADLAEMAPYVRNMFLSFANENGLIDVRILDSEGRTLLSAYDGSSALTARQRKAAAIVWREGERILLPAYGIRDGGLAADMMAPIGDPETGNPVAVLMISLPVHSILSQVLSGMKVDEMTSAYLIQKRPDGQWEKVQLPMPVPLNSGMSQMLSEHDGSLAFGERDSIEIRTSVWSCTLSVPGGPWFLAYEVASEEINRVFSHDRRLVILLGGCAWASLMLLAMLFWWSIAGRYQKSMLQEMQRLHKMLVKQKSFLDSINESLEIGLFMADVRGRILICNSFFAAIFRRQVTEIVEHDLKAVFTPEERETLLDHIRQVAISRKGFSCEMERSVDGDSRLYRLTLFPFDDSEDMKENVRGAVHGAVVTMQDITEFRRRAQNRERQQKALIRTFIKAVESVDPYLSGHSERMAQLGKNLVGILNLDAKTAETIIEGSRLSQIGKLFVERNILTKEGSLSSEEIAALHQAPEYAFNLLKEIDFDLPIPRALYEMYENSDGSGYPRGLKEEDILPAARVLGVLNAFCGMTSARSYRRKMSCEQALSVLNGNPKFDQTVVAGLRIVIESRSAEATSTENEK